MSKKNSRHHDLDVELSLERGQVTTLIVGSVLAIGAVFLVGVGVGRRLSPVPEKQAKKHSARPVEQTTPALTFHDALTERRVVVAAAEATPKQVAPGVKPGGREKTPLVAQQVHAALEVARAGAASAVAALVNPSKADKNSVAPDMGHTDPQSGNGTGTSAVASTLPAKPAPAKEVASKPSYTVQVASSRAEADVNKLATKLRGKGYTAQVVPAEIPGRGRWYRVRVGNFEKREEATKQQAELKVALDLSGLVVAN